MRRFTLVPTAGIGLVLALLLAAGSPAGATGARTNPNGSATNANGTSGPPVATVPPTISRHGRVAPGTELSCSTGTWANDPTAYRERWREHRKLVHTGAIYRVTNAEAGKPIACYVTASNPQGSTIALAGTVTVTR